MKCDLEERIKLMSNEIEKINKESNQKNLQLYDESAIAEFLDSLLSFSPSSIDKEFIDKFVYQIIQQSDNHFTWVLNLDGKQKQTIIAKIEGRKGKGRVDFVGSDCCNRDEVLSTHKKHDLGGESKKDDSDEDYSSSESSNCTYKSVCIGHSFVQS